jgi:hypothetical protein
MRGRRVLVLAVLAVLAMPWAAAAHPPRVVVGVGPAYYPRPYYAPYYYYPRPAFGVYLGAPPVYVVPPRPAVIVQPAPTVIQLPPGAPLPPGATVVTPPPAAPIPAPGQPGM